MAIMKKAIAVMGILALAACEDKVGSPLELVKKTTSEDTYNYCMELHDNKEYCGCEVDKLQETFPWDDYIAAVDIFAGEENHIGKVIAKHNGNRKKILEDLNCDTCYFPMAMIVVDVSPNPDCAKFLPDEVSETPEASE